MGYKELIVTIEIEAYQVIEKIVKSSVKSTMKRIATIYPILYDVGGFEKISAIIYA